MTLISAVNEVCGIVLLDQFSGIVGSSDDAALTMLSLANEAGQEIARRGDWQDLLQTATAVSSPSNLPSDFQRVTSIRTSAGAPVRPVTDAGQWAVIVTVPSTTAFYFLRGNQIRFSPASAAVGALIDYYSRKWALNAGTPLEAFNADDNTTIFPERLLIKNMIWRWKRQKGLTYDDNLAEFEADLAQEIAADGGVL